MKAPATGKLPEGWVHARDPLDDAVRGQGPVRPTIGERGHIRVLAVQRDAGRGALQGVTVGRVRMLTFNRVAHRSANLVLQVGAPHGELWQAASGTDADAVGRGGRMKRNTQVFEAGLKNLSVAFHPP